MLRLRFVALLLLLPLLALAQLKKTQLGRLSQYFDNYVNENVSNTQKIKVEDVRVDKDTRTVHFYINEPFVFQPFTPQLVTRIYEEIKPLVPAPYNTFNHVVYADGTPIEQLIPADQLGRRDSARTYMGRDYKGNAWVTPLHRPYTPEKGLLGRHLAVCQSHGRYYNVDKQLWEWQRPYLFGTVEDVFTQTFLIPYLYPMLEQAGAIVYTPRERDWQRQEVIVDNDIIHYENEYTELNGKYEWATAGEGFAWCRPIYTDGQNPFMDGTCRRAECTTNKHQLSSITWRPYIQQAGDYAVYVSYKTLPNSVSDALYTVRHGGVNTTFRVNQQMGGSTWVYLGTFHFDAGFSTDNCVFLTNHSNYRGVVTADAVRFGGGMGNVARGGTDLLQPLVSGLPRALEASRYSAQWYGFPDTIYHSRDADYNDDIITRPSVINLLSRGSIYNPGDSGRCVPIELSMGVHSDAGYRPDSSLIGTLGIYTSDFNEGRTAAGLSRLTSRDMVDIVMSHVTSDLTRTFGLWNRRAMYDRNYGETREPQMPAMILEMLSHQNWADMRLGHDPFFKFTLARAVYKGILHYLSYVHGIENPVTQPLPVTHLSAHLDMANSKVKLSWEENFDELDETARPTHYIIYTAVGHRDFDNGTLVTGTTHELDIEPGYLYRYRVAAVNKGGASAQSEEVCAFQSTSIANHILLVDGFQRVAGPLAFDNDSTGGFDFFADGGVPDVRTMGYTGAQTVFRKDAFGKAAPDGFGFSGSEWEGMVLAGNTHDYATRHALDILASGMPVHISSCTADALSSMPLHYYRAMDVIMGAQRVDGYSMRYYKTFTPDMCNTLQQFTNQGGSLLVSGAYLGTDMQTDEERLFLSEILKCRFEASVCTDSIGAVAGMNTSAQLYTQPSEQHYWVRRTDVLSPTEGAFCAMLYQQPRYSAAVAFSSQTHKVMTFGFPLECITDNTQRRDIMAASLQFLLQ